MLSAQLHLSDAPSASWGGRRHKTPFPLRMTAFARPPLAPRNFHCSAFALIGQKFARMRTARSHPHGARTRGETSLLYFPAAELLFIRTYPYPYFTYWQLQPAVPQAE